MANSAEPRSPLFARRAPWLLLAAGLLAFSSLSCKRADIANGRLVLRGAGATFPNPLYQKWCETFNHSRDHIRVQYESVGSGAGVRRFLRQSSAPGQPFDEAEAVDFGASDSGLSEQEMAEAAKLPGRGGAQLIPATGGAIAVVYNLPGLVKPLRLRRGVLADIFLGEITRWNDPRILEDNPDAPLPDRTITLCVREDGSGTTFAFTNHLAAISEKWKTGPGVGRLASWPSGAMRAKGNEGVAGLVKKSVDSIGYVEYGYAKRIPLQMAALQNREGNFVVPSGGTGLAALLEARLPENFLAFFPDPPGKHSYPIVTYTWLLVYRNDPDAERGAAVKEFLAWCLTEGQQYSEALGFIRLPPETAARALAALEGPH